MHSAIKGFFYQFFQKVHDCHFIRDKQMKILTPNTVADIFVQVEESRCDVLTIQKNR